MVSHMATLTIQKLLNVQQALTQVNTGGLNGKPVYAIARNLNKIAPLAEAFGKRRDQVIKEVAGEDRRSIDQTDRLKVEQFSALMEKEVEVEVDINFHNFILTEDQLTGIPAQVLAILLDVGIVNVLEVTSAEPKAA